MYNKLIGFFILMNFLFTYILILTLLIFEPHNTNKLHQELHNILQLTNIQVL